MRALVAIALLAAACGDTTFVDPMERQPKNKSFSANPFYEDGRGMRQPPAGTVPPTVLPRVAGIRVEAVPTKNTLAAGRAVPNTGVAT